MPNNNSEKIIDLFKQQPRRVLAVQDKDQEFLRNSASGGAFAVFARGVIRRGGVVYGVALDSSGRAYYCAATSLEELSRLQGSKYVQAETNGVFLKVQLSLEKDRLVLFSGLPCQVFALRSYLEKHEVGTSNLLTCDLVCHGVTDPVLLKMYFSWMEKRFKAKEHSIVYKFRSKSYKWGYYYSLAFSDKHDKLHSIQGPAFEDPYYRGYLSGQLFKDRCYSCRFATKERVGDFTIGDYWGIEKVHPEFYSNEGVSLLMLNSEKSERFFDEYVSEDCRWINSTFEQASVENINLQAPTRKTEEGRILSEKVCLAQKNNESDLIFSKLLLEPGIKAAVRRKIPKKLLRLIGKEFD